MSDDKTVKVNTSELRTAAGTMSDVHGRVNTVVTNLENMLNAKGYPWGHDSYGDKFTGVTADTPSRVRTCCRARATWTHRSRISAAA